jgi:hypothetical protein
VTAARRSSLFVSCSVDHVVEEAEAELTVQLSLFDNVFIFFLFLSGTTCCCCKEGYTCHFNWHLTPLVHLMDSSAIYRRKFQVDAS